MSSMGTRVAMLLVVVTIAATGILLSRPLYPQATGIFPQVVSCVQENPSPPTSDPDWQPPLIVKVEPDRDPGRVKEYRVLGCRLYYYHVHFG